MEDLFLALDLLAILAFLLSWIIPSFFMKLFKNKLSKGKTRLVLGLSIIVFFIAFGVSSDSAKDTVKDNGPKKEELDQITNQDIKSTEVPQLQNQQPDVTNEKEAQQAEIDAKNKADADAKAADDAAKQKAADEAKAAADAAKQKAADDAKAVADAAQSEKDFKASCKSISYKELFRNIDQYKDQKVYYTGKVVQVMGDGNFLSSMRVEVTRGSYDIWDDVVLLNNLDVEAPKILEDDIIKFWGVVEGEQTYQTVLGAQITVPEINAEIIELVK